MQRHHMQDSVKCNLCGQEDETIHHLLLGCVYSREVWARLLRSVGLLHLYPAQDDELATWWLAGQKASSKERMKGFDSIVILVWWNIGKECNTLLQK
jgi:hypothetical protein